MPIDRSEQLGPPGISGSHHIHSKPGERSIPVHGGKNPKLGLAFGIARDAGVSMWSRRTGSKIMGATIWVAGTGQWYNSGYTEGVKTAVSMPDDLFRMAEATARRLHVSRSELYAKAIADYLKLQQGDAITERLNDVYSQRPAKLDSGLHRAQLKSLAKDVW